MAVRAEPLHPSGWGRVVSFAAPDGATLVRRLGAGSTFEVAIVSHRGQERICKRLTARMLQEPAAHHALERESQALRLARHPALPELVTAGADQWGPYLVQARLTGASLRELVVAYRERGGPVPSGLVRHGLRGAFAALAELHALSEQGRPLGLLHGDLGPDHVLLRPDGAVFFLDFGQARWDQMAPELRGEDRGTLPFVAPELARGECDPSQQADVFALAAAMAFFALGREPCAALSPAARLVEVADQGLDLAAIAACEVLDGSDREVLLEALAYHAEARLRRATEVLARLGP